MASLRHFVWLLHSLRQVVLAVNQQQEKTWHYSVCMVTAGIHRHGQDHIHALCQPALLGYWETNGSRGTLSDLYQPPPRCQSILSPCRGAVQPALYNTRDPCFIPLVNNVQKSLSNEILSRSRMDWNGKPFCQIPSGTNGKKCKDCNEDICGIWLWKTFFIAEGGLQEGCLSLPSKNEVWRN